MMRRRARQQTRQLLFIKMGAATPPTCRRTRATQQEASRDLRDILLKAGT